MNNTLLLQQFDLLATAPGGVAKLRELILTLAVQGKLVPQDPADEPASALLKRIRAEKDRLIAEGKIKRDKPLAPIGEDEQPFGLPPGWEWVRLGSVVNASEAGWSPTCIGSPRRPGHWGVLKVSAVSWGKFDAMANKELPPELSPKPEYEVKDGDFLLSRANTAELVARSVVVGKAKPKLMLSDKIIRLDVSSQMNRVYLNLCNNNDHAREHYAAQASGTSSSMKNVSREVVLATPIPLPPLPEQTRIVARVEELMRVCDALEATGQRQAAHHRQLVQTLLGDLTADSHTSWQRVAAHFDTLLDRPSAVDALEQTILQLAVRGQLVPQDPADEPASTLLKRIRAEKDRLIAAGKIKRDKPLAPIGEDEQPFELPPGWEWTSLGEICVLITDGTHQTPKYTEAGLPFLSAKNVKPFRFMPNPHRFVSETDFHILRSGRIPNKGDILMTRVGAMIGEAAVIDQEIDFAFYVSLALLGMPANLVASQYAATWLNSPFGTTKSVEKTLGRGVSAGNLNLSFIRSFAVPLPPLPEQARIVARVAQLRRLCADLRQRLTQSQTTQAALAESLAGGVAAAQG